MITKINISTFLRFLSCSYYGCCHFLLNKHHHPPLPHSHKWKERIFIKTRKIASYFSYLKYKENENAGGLYKSNVGNNCNEIMKTPKLTRKLLEWKDYNFHTATTKKEQLSEREREREKSRKRESEKENKSFMEKLIWKIMKMGRKKVSLPLFYFKRFFFRNSTNFSDVFFMQHTITEKKKQRRKVKWKRRKVVKWILLLLYFSIICSHWWVNILFLSFGVRDFWLNVCWKSKANLDTNIVVILMSCYKPCKSQQKEGIY